MNAVAHNMDPHSSYLSPRQSEEYRIQMSLSYDGIGASLQLEDDYVKVMNIIPGGPAQIDGQLKPEDRITAVGEGRRRARRRHRLASRRRRAEDSRPRRHARAACRSCRQARRPARPEKIIELVRDKIKLEEQAAKKEPSRDSVRRQALSHRRHHGAELLSGLRRAQPRRRGLHEHVARRHAAHRGVQGRRRHRRPRHGPARERRRPPVRSHRALRPVHRAWPDRAAARNARHDPSSSTTRARRRSTTARWRCSSIATAPARRRSSPPRFRTTTAASSSANRRSARAPCRICFRSIASCAAPTTASSRSRSASTIASPGESTQHRGVIPDIELPSMVDTATVGESTRDTALPWDRIQPTRFRADPALASEIDRPARASATARSANDPEFATS